VLEKGRARPHAVSLIRIIDTKARRAPELVEYPGSITVCTCDWLTNFTLISTHLTQLRFAVTPAISFNDLSRRLGSFGSVTALDILGNSWGDRTSLARHANSSLSRLRNPNSSHVRRRISPHYISLSGINALSGYLWNGVKILIREVKFDARER
jgi:hypothetical protein